ncbi:hypothetical protein RHMOL_Rhmol04G0049900 [Rhododendron molle]|uniref:Uncharacterized protein n=1 Tax=Rhododendron molle TaxID=49168 RepID=A0ACC0NXF4_RHOML|nr:hypothetical protein RHMOL_Rhmol04G0049900 [Rhododendron molle]
MVPHMGFCYRKLNIIRDVSSLMRCSFSQRKVVVKVCSMNGQKSRSKALKIVVGVESVALKGQENDQIEVTGDDIDAVAITTSLRKKVGFAELVAVAPVEEKKADPKTDDKGKEPTIQPLAWPSGVPYGTPAPYYVQEIKYNDDPACCSIM